MTDVSAPAMSHRATVSRSRGCTISQSSAAVAVNDVRYPPLAFIDQTAQAGVRRNTEVIQKLRLAPRSVDPARNKKRTPAVQSASMASFSGTAPVPNRVKLRAPAMASIDEKP